MRAQIEIVKNDPTVLVINDLDGTRSVTNDAEDVVKFLISSNLLEKGKRLIYRDTESTYDEIIHNGIEFVAFKFLRNEDVQKILGE